MSCMSIGLPLSHYAMSARPHADLPSSEILTKMALRSSTSTGAYLTDPKRLTTAPLEMAGR